jgi:hypothetical protein
LEYADRTEAVLPPLPPMTEQADLTNRPQALIGNPDRTHVLAVLASDAVLTLYSLGIFAAGRGVIDPALGACFYCCCCSRC